jgi:MOSC domain-containing protein YiiM
MTGGLPHVELRHVLAGKSRPFTRSGSATGIDKVSLSGAVEVGRLGIVGDEQGDRRIHGGIDKAIHHYPLEHYQTWVELIGEHPRLAQPGAFGENLSTVGLNEHQVCLGDIFRCGGVLLEVSQTRQPCWKLNDRFSVSDMAVRMQTSAMTGWYYRVLQCGTLQAGDPLLLEDRPCPQWPLRKVIALLYERTLDIDALRQFSRLSLVPSWRSLVERRLVTGNVENWHDRIHGPSSGE